jgi:integrase
MPVPDGHFFYTERRICMSKCRSLENQMLHALASAKSQGESKRSYRADRGDTGAKIFSLSYETDLRSTIGNFSQYLKDNTKIRYVKDIQRSDLQNYLKEKSLTCNYETCQKLKSHLVKIEKICTSRYGRCIDWQSDRLTVLVNVDRPVNIKDYVATQMDYNKLKFAMQTGRSETWKSVVLSRYAGCRVRETAYIKVGRYTPEGGRWGFGTVTLQGKSDGTKGGRWRTYDIISRDAQRELSEVFSGRSGGEYVIQQKDGSPVDPKSITRAMERACKRVDVDLPKYNKNHAFRKLFAQECYDLIRSAGASKKESLDYAASNQLGHGIGRGDSAATYVHNQW